MKSLMFLWKVLALDMGERCFVDTTRDFKTVVGRTESEGIGFLTITLPTYLKAFERWLEIGHVDPTLLTGFRLRGGLPVFLRGFLDQIFSADGAVSDSASPEAVLAIRQLTGVFGKLFLQASAERTTAAMLQYLKTDDEVERWSSEWTQDGDPEFSRMATLLFGDIFNQINADVAYGRLIPRHGGGSTAEKILGNAKFSQITWHWRLEGFFPSSDYLLPNARYHSYLDTINFVELEDELPVRVISVPKTQKTPRIIAAEPICMQYTQQAMLSRFAECIAFDNLVSRFIPLENQVVNQVLAREGSINGSLATLDLSEASDRVPNALVRTLLGNWEHLDGAVQACRSVRANVQLGDKSVVTREIAKFASMGSALTFPIEAMVFLTVVMLGIQRAVGRRLRRDHIIGLQGKVAVYGDDIIVPVDYVESVVHEL